MPNSQSKMKEKFEMGPIQKKWIEQLRKHPERQGFEVLGTIQNDGSYKLCCLGQLHLIGCELNRSENPFHEGHMHSAGSDMYLVGSWARYGLRSAYGCARKPITKGEKTFPCLSTANDAGLTWPEIADSIEANPENFFTKPV